MSGLWGDPEDDQATLDALVRETQAAPEGRPLFGMDFFTEIPKGIGRAFSTIPLAGDQMARDMPVRPGLGELSVLKQAEDEDVPVSEIVQRRINEIDQKTDEDYARFKALSPDPVTSSYAGMITNTLADYGTRAVAGSIVGGVPGAMALSGATEYAPAKMDMLEQGVDPATAEQFAAEQATFVGLMAGAPAALPGKLLTRIGSGAAINAGLGGVQRGRAEYLLRENGYGDIADRYKVFDASAIVTDALLGGFFGALHSPGVPHEALDAAMVAQDAQRRDAQSPFGLPVNNEADRQIAAADARAMEQIANGEPIDVADIFDEGRPVTLEELDAMQAPYEAPEEIVQSFLSWQKSPKPEAPMSLMEFVKSMGGLKTKVFSEGEMKREVNAGEIESLGRYPGLVNNTAKGMHPDDMARAAWEAGYMGDGADTWNIDDLFRLLREETVGNKIYPSEDTDTALARGDYDQATREAARLGIRKNTPEARVRELLAQSEYAQQRGSQRAEYAPIDPDAAIRAELETIFAEVRDEIAAVMGDETPTDWMASRGVYHHKFGATTRLRDFLIERAAGMSDADIAAEYDVDLNAISASLSRFRDRVEARVARGDTLQNIAEEMRLTMDVVEKAMELKPARKPEARDVVLSLAMKGLDNGQIAERMRGMGFERTTKESVKVMKSNLRKAGHDIPKGAKGGTDFQASRGEAPVAATPKSDLEAALTKSFGKSSQKLMSTSKVELLNTVEELNAATGRTLPKDTKAVSNRGKTYVVAQNVSPSEARGILLHEVGVHHGMADMLGEQGMARLKVAMDALLASGNPAVKEARALAEGFALKPEHVDEETIAYLVEHHPDMPIVRRLLAQIRQWLWRVFPDLVDLTPDDIAMMAVASLRRAANEDMRQGFGDWMTSFGGALATREGRARWANGKDVKKFDEGADITYEFETGTGAIAVQFHREQNGAWGVVWDWAKNVAEDNQFAQASFGDKPFQSLGQIIAIVERFIDQQSPKGIHFAGLSNAHTKLYSRMVQAVLPDGWKAWDVSGEQNRAHEFAIVPADTKVKEMFPQATPMERVLTNADITAKADRARDFGVRAYLEWFRDSGGDEMRASRGKKRDTEMNDPVKAAIAEDPTMKIPDEKGELLPVNEALMKADELFKNASELSKGFEAAGACAARHAASMVSQAELRTAELVGGFAWGAATAGAIANVAAPAIMEMNNQAYANDLQRRADETQAALAEDRAQFIKENPVTSIPVGRSLDNTIMHAADRTGVPENFLSALIKKESGGDANAKAATSSATGMTQFIDGTWRNELIRVGSKLGFKGDPYSAEALELRKDPRWSVMVAAEFAKANAQDMKAAIGRDPTHGEVYLAHFMGLRGAVQLINAADQGVTNAASLFPEAAAANQNVFHGSAKDVLKRQTKGFSNEPFVVNQ